MLLDFAASQSHYLAHLRPVWDALEPDERGRFFIPRGTAAFEGATVGRPRARDEGPICVAGPTDLARCGRRPVVLVEHGAGQAYSEAHVSYSGGPGRDAVVLFLCPNEVVAERNRAAYPDAAVEVVGSPRVEALGAGGEMEHPFRPPFPSSSIGETSRRRLPTAPSPLRIVLSHHWDCRLWPESRWALPHFVSAYPELVERFDVVGHGHPRFASWWRHFWPGLGVRYESDFERAIAGAEVFVSDNSSALYEAAALGIPVVVMSAPWYRREVDLFPRFWRYANVGVQVSQANDLRAAIEEAAADRPEQAQARHGAVHAVWGEIPGSAKRAAEAIRSVLAR